MTLEDMQWEKKVEMLSLNLTAGCSTGLLTNNRNYEF